MGVMDWRSRRPRVVSRLFEAYVDIRTILFNTRAGLLTLLLLVFVANCGETWLESRLRRAGPIGAAEYRGAFAVQMFEPASVDFRGQDASPAWATYLYSFWYFIVPPLVGAGLLVALVRRGAIAPLRVLCLAVAAAYLVSLPWFLLFPVPERWAYPGSGAILLSDQWSAGLINALRPVRGLNNSFPSIHVSLTVIMVLVCWLFRVRFRRTVTALGLATILATFALGIDWLAGIVAGIVVGTLGVVVGVRFTDQLHDGWRSSPTGASG